MPERHRTRGGFSNPITLTWGNSNTSQGVTASNSATVYLGIVDVMDDIVTPEFEKVKNSGKIVNNPMSKETLELGGSSVGPKFQTTVSGITYFLDYNLNWMAHSAAGGLPALDRRVMTGYQDLLVETQTRARSNIAKPSFGSLVSLGELGETLHYLRNPLKTGLKLAQNFQVRKNVLAKSLNAEFRKQGVKGRAVYTEYSLRSLKGVSARSEQIIKDLSDLYLEFRYGVRPLVYDVSSLMDQLNAGIRSKRQNARSMMTRSETSVVNNAYTLFGINYNRTETLHQEVTIRAGFLFEYQMDLMEERWGFRAADVFQAAYELYPLSFVADWFVNVNDFIGAITPRSGVNYLAEYTSHRMSNLMTHTYGTASYSTWSTVRQPSGSHTSRVVQYNRVPSVQIPALTFRTDNIRLLAHDSLKLLDLFTLTLQRVV